MYSDPDSTGLENKDFDVVINGHSHVNDLSEQIIDGKRIVYMNPGSPSRPRGYSKASYGMIVFNDDGSVSFRLHALQGDGVLSEKTVSFNQASIRNN